MFLVMCSLSGEDFIRFGAEQPSMALSMPEKKKQKIAFQKLDGRDALRIDWEAKAAYFWEIALKTPIQLPEYDEANLTFSIYLPENSPARNLNVRLLDRDGEYLQYRTPMPAASAAGWRDVVITLDRKPAASSWGGGKKANKIPDFPVTFLGLASEFKTDAPDSYLGIGNASLEITAGIPELTLETGRGNAAHLLMPGDEALLKLRIRNLRKEPKTLTLNAVITDEEGKKTGEILRKITPDERDITISLSPPKRFGVTVIQAELKEDGGEIIRKRMSYAYMNPAGPTPGRAKGFLFGMCVHSQRFSRSIAEREAQAAAWCGAKVFREDISWYKVEPKQGEWNWNAYDYLIGLYGQYNIELQGIFVWVPGWVLSKFQESGSPEEWNEFVRRFCERYRDRVRYMEVWNEPDINTFSKKPDLYLSVIQNTYRTMKAVAPEMKVLTGGFSGMVTTENQTAFLRKVLGEGKESYDIIAFHGHGSLESYLPHINAMLAAREEFGIEAPWYANETAVPSNWSSEIGQSQTLIKKLLVSWARGAIGYNCLSP